MGFVIPKILHHLNVVWLFNVKQGFCLSRTLLLFGVVPNFFYIFQIRGFQCFFSLLYKIWSITTRDICLHSTVEVCFSSFKNTTIPPRNADSSVSWNFKKTERQRPTRPTVFSQFNCSRRFFFKQISQVKNLVINTGGLIFPKRVTKVSKVF